MTVAAAAFLVGCGTEPPEATSTRSSAPSTVIETVSPSPSARHTTPAVETPSPTPSVLPSPVTSALEHGGSYVGVYLAVGAPGSAALDRAIRQLADLGIEAYAGDIACDQGAAEQLGVSSDVQAVALYFETRRDARTWASALDPAPLGIARVTTYCLD